MPAASPGPEPPKLLCKILEDTISLSETKILRLNTFKSKKVLNFSSKLTLINSIDLTINWYKNYYDGKISILIWVLLSGLECIIKEGQINSLNNYSFLQKSYLKSP